jgi:hypothetical protein
MRRAARAARAARGGVRGGERGGGARLLGAPPRLLTSLLRIEGARLEGSRGRERRAAVDAAQPGLHHRAAYALGALLLGALRLLGSEPRRDEGGGGGLAQGGGVLGLGLGLALGPGPGPGPGLGLGLGLGLRLGLGLGFRGAMPGVVDTWSMRMASSTSGASCLVAPEGVCCSAW